MASKEIVVIDRMIDLMNRKAVKGVYGRLITLHPSPSKDILLPFINESSLAIVCISLLLNADKVVYEGDERKRSMFKSVPDSELDLCRSRSLSAGN